MEIKSIQWSANRVAHSLGCYARHIDEDIVWLEDSPPPALEALYLDSLSIFNQMKLSLLSKEKKLSLI